MGRRLRTDIRPLNYRIEIETDFRTFAFLGKEDIELQLGRPYSEITLNASELTIRNVNVTYKGKTQKAVVLLNKKGELATFRFASKVDSGAVLHIEFSGKNGDGMYGFYRSRYSNGTGKNAYILSSHFEPAHARTAFPCFDEPSFKAQFRLSIVTDSDLETISNMPVESVRKLGSRKRVAFMPTPKMSSYLLYIGVGRFGHVSLTYRGKRLRAFAVPGKVDGCRLALDYAKRFLAFYERYFGIEYPLPKMDLIAVPDFAAGAMENWGAITFREQDMLYGKHTSTRVRTRIAETVSHELAHQWFGDLVTMKWWDDTWLNEAFAEFMSFKAVEAVFPEWKRGLDFFDEEVDVALGTDEFRNTHPIYSQIKSVEEIDKVFDDISYRKGAAVLRMLEDFIGDADFRRGLHDYLLKHALSNAEKDDLWDALSGVSAKGRGVKDLVTSWITMAGYPALHVNGSSVTQERFFLSKRERATGTWPVPVHYVCGGGSPGFVVMDAKRASLPRCDGWIKLNCDQTGVYRVFYDDASMSKLAAAVKSGKLGNVDAWGLANDMYVLARSGRIRIDGFLKRMKAFYGCGYPTDLALLNSLTSLYILSYGTDSADAVLEHLRDYSNLLIKRLGWKAKKGDQGYVKRMRSGAILASGRCGERSTITKCVSMLDSALSGKPVDNELRRTVYQVAAINRDGAFGKLVRLYRKAGSAEEKVDALIGMAMSGRERSIKDALAFSLSKEVRLQDGYIIPYIMSLNPRAPELLWKWMEANWKSLKARYKPGTLLLGEFASSLSCVKDERLRGQIGAFFAKKANMREDIKLNIRKTLELIDVNIDCLQFNNGR